MKGGKPAMTSSRGANNEEDMLYLAAAALRIITCTIRRLARLSGRCGLLPCQRRNTAYDVRPCTAEGRWTNDGNREHSLANVLHTCGMALSLGTGKYLRCQYLLPVRGHLSLPAHAILLRLFYTAATITSLLHRCTIMKK
jgi:hypothetical protein